VLLCQGAATADWVTRLPSIKAGLHLGAGELGLALVGTPLGLAIAVLAVPVAIRRFSGVTVARWGSTCAALSIAIPALAWSGASLAIGLVILGLAFGTSEVGVNVQAVAVERAFGRPVMAGMHAMWSLGFIIGSLAGSLAAAAGVSPIRQLVVAGVALAGIAALAGHWFLDPQLAGPADPVAQTVSTRARLLEQPAVLLTGLIAFCALLTEGSVSDWAGVYLHSVQHASLAVAALAISVYSVGQMTMRLGGNKLVTRLGQPLTISCAAVLAAAGLLLALAAHAPSVALLGYGVLGLGGAMIIPTAFSIAGIASSVTPAWSLSRVTVMGYAGSFLGPAAIGLVSRGVGLRTALTIPAGLLLLIVPLTLRLRRYLVR
jgi:fucose permease